MLTWALRLVSLLFVVVAALTASVRIDLAERDMPVSADFGMTVTIGSADKSKVELAQTLTETASKTHASIALVGRDKEDAAKRVLFFSGASNLTCGGTRRIVAGRLFPSTLSLQYRCLGAM